MVKSVNDRVRAARPDGTELTISRASFNGVYQYRGWTLVDDQPDLDKKTRDQLNDVATGKGIDPAAYRTKADLIAAIEDAD